MSQNLTAKQRAAALQQWQSVIVREGRDLESLDRVGARALQDHDVRADVQLQGMVQAELQRRRAELEREAQRGQGSGKSVDRPPLRYSGGSRRVDTDVAYAPGDREDAPSAPPPKPPPDPDRVAFRRLVADFDAALKGADEEAARAVCAQLRALRERRVEVVSAMDLASHEERVARLHAKLDGHRHGIRALGQEAQTAARRGDSAGAVKLLHRLTAIHLAYPQLLAEADLQATREAVAQASEGHDDAVITRELIERERAVAAEMRRLAHAVSGYHEALLAPPADAAGLRRAARVYADALREVHLHEKNWLADFVLELADVLAKWSTPPPGAEQQIDRFLERIRKGIARIHTGMGRIDREQP